LARSWFAVIIGHVSSDAESATDSVGARIGCSMSTGCMRTIAEVVGSIPHEFNQLQNRGGSPWTSLEVILGTVNPLVGGSNPSRGANF